MVEDHLSQVKIMKDKEFRALVDNLYDGIYFVDNQRTITYWNKAAERLSGFTSREILGKHCFANILDHCDGTGKQLCFNGCPLHATLEDGVTREADVYLRQKNGLRRPVSVRVAPVKNEDGEIIGAVEIFSDNSSKLAVLEELQQVRDVAYLDELTGVCNRRSLDERLRAKHLDFLQEKVIFGISMIDIDHFKRVNDTYGHLAGDVVLKMVAKVLARASRSFDIIGRWGGEEFLVLFSNIDKEMIFEICDRHRVLIEKSFVVNKGEHLSVTASFGCTLAKEGEEIKDVIDRADKLLYQSKKNGRNQVTFG